VTNGTTYYYVVASIKPVGTSTNSTQISATPAAAAALPSGWVRQDIGTVSAAGSASYSTVGNNTYIVSGSGTGIGGAADAFSYAYTSVTGDYTLTARLINISGTLSRTGIMFRESLATGATNPGDEAGRCRLAAGRVRNTLHNRRRHELCRGNDYTWLPAWFRLQRSRQHLHCLRILRWDRPGFTVGASTVTMANTYYVGLAPASGSTTGALDNTTFDNVTVVAGAPQPIPNGTYKILARHSGKALDVTNNGTADGTNVQQWSAKTAPASNGT